MKVLKSDKYIWQILLGTFFLSGFIHVILYGVPYTDSIVQIFDGTVVLCWIAAVLRRIVDKRVRLYLVWIGALMMGYFALQMSKYKLFSDHVLAQRYVWYGFYLPMIQNKPDFSYDAPLLTEIIHEAGISGSIQEERIEDAVSASERIITITLQEGGII